MSSKLTGRKWFKELKTAAVISLDMMDRCISDMSMRQLSMINADNVLDMALNPGSDAYVNAVSQALIARLSLCGLVERASLAKYRRRKNISQHVLDNIDFNLARIRLKAAA